MSDNFFERFLAECQMRESIASVSLSHEEHCDCIICRAAKGDEEAFQSLMKKLFSGTDITSSEG